MRSIIPPELNCNGLEGNTALTGRSNDPRRKTGSAKLKAAAFVGKCGPDQKLERSVESWGIKREGAPCARRGGTATSPVPNRASIRHSSGRSLKGCTGYSKEGDCSFGKDTELICACL